MKLQTAVIQEIFILKKFSAHDVTNAIRAKVNNGELNIPELPVTDVAVGDTTVTNYDFEVKHETVRDIVVDIFENLKQVVPLTRKNQGYWFYELQENCGVSGSVVKVASKSLQSVSNFVGGFLGRKVDPNTGLSSDTTPPIHTVVLDPLGLNAKLKKYVENKKFVNEPATLRGAHSSIKQVGTTLADIQDAAESLGYKVKPQDGQPYYQSLIV